MQPDSLQSFADEAHLGVRVLVPELAVVRVRRHEPDHHVALLFLGLRKAGPPIRGRNREGRLVGRAPPIGDVRAVSRVALDAGPETAVGGRRLPNEVVVYFPVRKSFRLKRSAEL